MNTKTGVLHEGDTETETEERVSSASKGRVILAPIDGSVERSALRLELDLTRGDGVLVLGDLRVAAEQQSNAGHHEAAHRLWAMVHTAASRVGHDLLVARSIAMGDGALLKLRTEARTARTSDRRSSGSTSGGSSSASKSESQVSTRSVVYDYVSLAADCADGMTQRETAAKWDCSTTTVSRAVRYVGIRDSLLEDSVELTDQIHRGKSVDELASEFDIESKVMRWIVSDYWDRRN